MNKTITCALIALITLITSVATHAQDGRIFTSNVTGFTTLITTDTKLAKNDIEAIILMTDNQEFLITALPFQPSKCSDNDIAAAINTLADNAGINVETASDFEINNKNLEGTVFIQKTENKSDAALGVLKAKQGDLAFYVTIIASANYANILNPVLKSLDFNPDAIKTPASKKATTKKTSPKKRTGKK